MDKKSTERVEAMAQVYVATNSAEYFAFGKPMRGVWEWGLFPMTADVIAGLCSEVEQTSEGLKFRFRPNNATFYRVAARAGVQVCKLASVDAVDALMVSLAAESGCKVNRGHAFEALTAAAVGADWSLNPIQAGYWSTPDYIAADGRTIQAKAYGASIPEGDLIAAVKACKQ